MLTDFEVDDFLDHTDIAVRAAAREFENVASTRQARMSVWTQNWSTTAGLAGGIGGNMFTRQVLAHVWLGNIHTLADAKGVSYTFSVRTGKGRAALKALKSGQPLTAAAFARMPDESTDYPTFPPA